MDTACFDKVDPNQSSNYQATLPVNDNLAANALTFAANDSAYTQQHCDNQNTSNDYASCDNMGYSHFSSKVDQFLDCIFNVGNTDANTSALTNVHADLDRSLTSEQVPGCYDQPSMANDSLRGARSIPSYELSSPSYCYDASQLSSDYRSLNPLSNEQYATLLNTFDDGTVNQQFSVNSKDDTQVTSIYVSSYQDRNDPRGINTKQNYDSIETSDKFIRDVMSTSSTMNSYDQKDYPSINNMMDSRANALVGQSMDMNHASGSSQGNSSRLMMTSNPTDSRPAVDPSNTRQSFPSKAHTRTELSKPISRNGKAADEVFYGKKPGKNARKRMTSFLSSVSSTLAEIEQHFLSASGDNPYLDSSANESLAITSRPFLAIVDEFSNVCERSLGKEIVDSVRIETLRSLVNQVIKFSQVSSIPPRR